MDDIANLRVIKWYFARLEPIQSVHHLPSPVPRHQLPRHMFKRQDPSLFPDIQIGKARGEGADKAIVIPPVQVDGCTVRQRYSVFRNVVPPHVPDLKVILDCLEGFQTLWDRCDRGVYRGQRGRVRDHYQFGGVFRTPGNSADWVGRMKSMYRRRRLVPMLRHVPDLERVISLTSRVQTSGYGAHLHSPILPCTCQPSPRPIFPLEIHDRLVTVRTPYPPSSLVLISHVVSLDGTIVQAYKELMRRVGSKG